MYCKKDVSVFVIGNKSDIGGHIKSHQKTYLDNERIKGFVVSAKTGKNVEESIMAIAKTAMNIIPKNKPESTSLGLR